MPIYITGNKYGINLTKQPFPLIKTANSFDI